MKDAQRLVLPLLSEKTGVGVWGWGRARALLNGAGQGGGDKDCVGAH